VVRTSRLLAVAMVLACSLPGPARSAESPPSTQPAGLPGVRIDVKARTVELDCKVVLARGPLELLLCLAGAKEHESILATDVRPSHVHGALLAVGLTPGRPGRRMAAGDDERFIPPAGPPLSVSVRYVDRGGQRRRVKAAEWIRQVRGKGDPQPVGWVFVGSGTAPDHGYAADRSGEIISVANFPRAVIDVPFASSTANELLFFEAATDAIPPLGTPVTVILAPGGDADRAAVARATFEIDRFGRYKLDGLAIETEKIAPWAEAFRQRHAGAVAIIHAAPRALAHDVQQLRNLLDGADIRDIEVHTRPVAGQILPRTEQQADKAMQAWRHRFDAEQTELLNPAAKAEVVLRQIEHRREELADLLKLWDDYRRRLAASLRAHRAAGEDKEPSP